MTLQQTYSYTVHCNNGYDNLNRRIKERIRLFVNIVMAIHSTAAETLKQYLV